MAKGGWVDSLAMLGSKLRPRPHAAFDRVPVACFRNVDIRVQWINAPGVRFDDPFFGDTIRRLLYARELVETGVAEVRDEYARRPGIPPSGFIFHVSRCGSTLLGNLLSSLPTSLVMSEPGACVGFLTELTSSPDLLSQEGAVENLRALIGVLGRPRLGVERDYFVKYSSPCLLRLPLIRAAFPNVPEIFLYREPMEVLASNLSEPHQSWLWLEAMTGLPLHEAVERSPVELVARAIGRKLEAMLQFATERTWLLNYDEIGPATPAALNAFFGLRAAAADLERMHAVLGVHSKDPARHRRFESDKASKAKRVTAAMRAMLEEHVGDAYDRLEALRVSRTTLVDGVQSPPEGLRDGR